jgi:hypothetical protein
MCSVASTYHKAGRGREVATMAVIVKGGGVVWKSETIPTTPKRAVFFSLFFFHDLSTTKIW